MRETPLHQGLPWEVVIVRGIDTTTNVAEVENHIGVMRQVPMAVLRTKGAKPLVGERWVIDKSLGQWTFAAVLEATPLVLTGSRSGGGALVNLLAALEEIGLFIDGTTA